MFSNPPHPHENRAVCEIMWKKYCRMKQAADDKSIRRMRSACWITKVTETHSEYVIVLAFPRQQWYANAPQCYVCTHIACHVVICACHSPLLSMNRSESHQCTQTAVSNVWLEAARMHVRSLHECCLFRCICLSTWLTVCRDCVHYSCEHPHYMQPVIWGSGTECGKEGRIVILWWLYVTETHCNTR